MKCFKSAVAIVTGLGALALASVSANADVYASAPVYGGSSATLGSVTCRVFNAGAPVSISQRQIFTNTNVQVSLTLDTCGGILGTNQYCAFGRPSVGNFAYSCKLTTVQNGTRLRGVAEAVSNTNAIVNSLPIAK